MRRVPSFKWGQNNRFMFLCQVKFRKISLYVSSLNLGCRWIGVVPLRNLGKRIVRERGIGGWFWRGRFKGLCTLAHCSNVPLQVFSGETTPIPGIEDLCPSLRDYVVCVTHQWWVMIGYGFIFEVPLDIQSVLSKWTLKGTPLHSPLPPFS